MFRIALAAAAALFATPALADNVFAELHGGYDAVTFGGHAYGGIAYGAGLGYEVTLHGKTYVAVQANADGSSAKSSFLKVKSGRDLSVVGKFGLAVTENISVYALAGYSNGRLSGPAGHRSLSGARVGGGWRYRVGQAYVKGEFVYTNYESGVARYQAIAGLGYLF